MRKRVHQLWIPGLLTMMLSTIFLIALQKLGLQPRLVGSGSNGILFYALWLASLPFFGALGTYLSAWGRRFAGNHASCRRFSRARAYCSVSLAVSDRLRR